MKHLPLIFSVLFLYSCATGYKSHGFGGGFSEQKLSSDMYLVQFSGNGYTGPSTVQAYLLRRCAELTLNEGFTHFLIVNSNNDTTSSLHANHSVQVYQNQAYGQTNINSINKHLSSATIKMISNPSKDQFSYDARVIFGNETEKERAVANVHTSSCKTSEDCQNGETCKIHYTETDSYGSCGNHGLWGKIFNP